MSRLKHLEALSSRDKQSSIGLSDQTAPTTLNQFIVSSPDQDSIRIQASGFALDIDSLRLEYQLSSYPALGSGTLMFALKADTFANDTTIYLQYTGDKTWYFQINFGDSIPNWSYNRDTVLQRDVTPPDSFDTAPTIVFSSPDTFTISWTPTDIDSSDWAYLNFTFNFRETPLLTGVPLQIPKATAIADSDTVNIRSVVYNDVFLTPVPGDTVDTLLAVPSLEDSTGNVVYMDTVEAPCWIYNDSPALVDCTYIVDNKGVSQNKIHVKFNPSASTIRNLEWISDSVYAQINVRFIFKDHETKTSTTHEPPGKTYATIFSDSITQSVNIGTVLENRAVDTFFVKTQLQIFDSNRDGSGIVLWITPFDTVDTLVVPDSFPPSPTGNFIAFGSSTLGYDSLAIRWQDSSATDITDSLIIAIFNQGTKPSSVDTTTADTVLRFNRFSEVLNYGQDWIVSDGDPDTLHLFGVFDDSLGNFIKWANADYDYTYISPTPGVAPDTDPPNTDSLQIAFVRVNFALFDSTGSPSDSPDVAYYIDSVKTEPSGSYSLIRTGSTVAYSRDSTSLAANFPTFESKAGNDTLFGKTVAVDTAGNIDPTGVEYKQAPYDTNFAYYINPDSLQLIDIRNGDITAIRIDISAGDSVSEGSPYYILSFEDTLTTFDFGDSLVLVIDSLHFDFAGNDSVYQRVALWDNDAGLWGSWSDWFLSTLGTQAGGGGGSATSYTADNNVSNTSAVDSNAVTITVNASADLLVVSIASVTGSGDTASTVLANGQALTKSAHSNRFDAWHASIWYLIDPPTGSVRIRANFVGSDPVTPQSQLVASSWIGAPTSGVVDDIGNVDGNQANFPVNLTTTTDSCLVIGAISTGAAAVGDVTIQSPGVDFAENDWGSDVTALSYISKLGVAGAHTIQWNTGGEQGVGVGVAFKPGE